MAVCGSIPGAKFLGASVIDFNASAGWGMQSSEVTINLAADCNEKFYPPVMGAAATFIMGSFIFTGIIQSWNAKQGTDGEIFSVKLVSPHTILEHTQVILDHYEGQVPFYNIANVYGFLESLGGNCRQQSVDGTFFGAPAGGFGNANKTGRGIPWYLVKQALEALAGGGSGASTQYCKGLGLAGTRYLLDLSSIPLANQNYRITGPVTSLSDLIDQVCQDAGCDYYIQSLPMALGSSRSHIALCSIKVVAIPRKDKVGAQSAISRFVAGKNVLNRNIGVELRSEINSAFLIGGKVKQYYQAVRGATPFWGWDADGGLIKSAHNPALGNLGWSIELDCRKINLALTNKLANKMWLGVNELRMAAADYESFETNVTNPTNNQSNLYKYYVNTLGIGELSFNKNRDRGAGDAPMDVQWNAEDDDPRGNPASQKFRDAKTVHNWLNSYVSEFYGKKFLVYFSIDTVVCRSVDTDTKQVVYSDIISSDGAWPHWNGAQEASHILGLPNPSFAADRFKDDAGKVQAMIKFHGNNLNTKGLNQDDFVLKDKDIWIKADVDEKYVDGTPLVGGPKNIKCALVTLANPVIDTDSDVQAVESNRPLSYIANQGPVVPDAAITTKPANQNPGGQGETAISFGPSFNLNPYGIGVPMESTTTCYGPWQAAGADPGGTSVEVDDGLVPWEYGGYGYMYAAGQAKIADSYTNQQDADRGEVTVPGIPLLSLANDLGGQGVISNYDRTGQVYRPLTSHNNIGGVNSSYMYFNSTQAGGAVISNISVSVGAGGVTTTYTVNSFTPVFGRFSKGNAERLKQIGLNQQKNERSRRANQALQNLLRASAGQNRSDTRSVSTDIGKGNTAPKSPGTFLVGKILNPTGGGTRKMVLVPSKTTMPYYAKSEANATAAMTMDGVFRPVQSASLSASNLPGVVSDTSTCGSAIPTQTSGPPPPVEGQTPLPIHTKYLDFLTNPKDVGGSWVGASSDRATDSTKGHDIEGVARGTAGNEWGGAYAGKLLMRSGDSNTDHVSAGSDYRFLALRGPLVIQGWGYDINGNPIPNKNHDSPNSFKTDYTDLTNQFANNWLEQASTWPVAPVDLRFDRKRGVWTVPPAFRLYQIEIGGAILAGQFGQAMITSDKSDILDADGTQVENPKISVQNWTKTTIPSGEKGLAYYDTNKCEYWIIPSPSGGGGSGVINVGVTGNSACDKSVIPCRELKSSGCLMFSGLQGQWYNITGGFPSAEGPDFIVEGPKIQSGTCAGETVGDPEAFHKLTFVSGLRSARGAGGGANYCDWHIGGMTLQNSGCGTPGNPLAFEHVIIGSGLKLEQLQGGDCTGLITGPQMQSGQLDGTAVGLAESFRRLTFVSGLRADKSSECNWKIGGPTIHKSGCDGPPEGPYGLSTLIIGSGIGWSDHGEGKIRITGPQAQHQDGTAGYFNKLIFKSGLQASNDGCTWEIGGPTLQHSPCGGPVGAKLELANLIISSGLIVSNIGFEGAGVGDIAIAGPLIQPATCSASEGPAESFESLMFMSGLHAERIGSSSSCKWRVAGTTIDTDVCGGGGQAVAGGLKKLVIGSGLDYEPYGGGECEWVVTGPQLSTKRVGTAVCPGGDQAIDPESFRTLTFSSGLTAVKGENCAWTLAGPKIQWDECADNAGGSIDATHFDLLTFRTGIIMEAVDNNECAFIISGPKIGTLGAAEEAKSFESLKFGSGLIMGDSQEAFANDGCDKVVNAKVLYTAGGCEVGECKPTSGCITFKGLKYTHSSNGDAEVEGLKVTATTDALDGGEYTAETAILEEGDLHPDGGGQDENGDPVVVQGDIGELPGTEGTQVEGLVQNLKIGENLRLTGGENCAYTLEAEAGGGAGCSEGITEDVDVVTSVCCHGSTFNIKISKLIFQDGCLTAVEPGDQDCEPEGE